MSSTIAIYITLDGDLTQETPIRFYPYMVDKTINKHIIYFPPSFKLTEELLRAALPDIKSNVKSDVKSDVKSNVKSDVKTDVKTDEKTDEKTELKDYRKIFTDPDLYYNLLLYVSKQKAYKNYSIKTAFKKGIIQHNYNFIQLLYLNPDSILSLNKKKYVIMKSDLKSSNYYKGIVSFSITVHLDVLDTTKNTFYNRNKYSCNERKQHINSLTNKLFNTNLFSVYDKLKDKTKTLKDKNQLSQIYPSLAKKQKKRYKKLPFFIHPSKQAFNPSNQAFDPSKQEFNPLQYYNRNTKGKQKRKTKSTFSQYNPMLKTRKNRKRPTQYGPHYGPQYGPQYGQQYGQQYDSSGISAKPKKKTKTTTKTKTKKPRIKKKQKSKKVQFRS